MPISRGQMPRQLYGLGSLVKSIGKAVKGAVKSVGKVAKSPLGLAALTYGLGGGTFFGKGLPGLARNVGGFKFGNIGPNIMNYLVGQPAIDQIGVGATKGLLGSGGKFSTLGKTAAVVAPSIIGGMLTKEAQEDVEQLRESGDRGLLQGYLRRYYGNLNPRASAEEIEEFVRVNSAEGGRIGFFEGAVAGGGNISPGTDVGGNVRNDNPFAGGGGDGPQESPSVINTPPETKTNKGIVSILNRFNPFNFLFPPAAAAEFDMEAFQKAGADKGFFGASDELKAMQEYYDAAKSLTAPGAKFAGANDPQAVRDFITKQSEIPFGGGSYSVDMDLVPKTFLETTEDFNKQKSPMSFFNLGGRAGYAMGDTAEQNAIQASGIMDLPLNKNPAGVTELDLRESGGFIPPVGVKEKADDIPAML